MVDVGSNVVKAPRASCRVVVTHDAPEPASAVRDDDGGWTLTYRPDATIEQVQAALDSVVSGYTITMVTPLFEAKAEHRRPGPGQRLETNAERNRRWRSVERG